MSDANSSATPDQLFKIGLFRNEDAPALVRLYANPNSGYPSQESFTNIEKVIERFGGANVYLVVAKSPAGEIIGYIDMFHVNIPAGTLFINMGFVSPDYRGQNIGNELMEYVVNILAVDLKVELVGGEILCHHTFMQKLIINYKGAIRGYDIALAVDGYNSQVPGEQRRTSALMMGGTFVSRPQTLYLPDIYKKELSNMYAAWHCWHRFLPANAKVPAGTLTVGKLLILDKLHVARINIFKIGTDLELYLRKTEEEVMNSDITVIQVYLPLTSPWTGGAVDVLRAHAYFLGGPIPRFYNPDNDALLMQKMFHEPNFAGIKLFSEHAQVIMDIVKKDWELVRGK